MGEVKSICVYCGSSNHISEKYKDLAIEMGQAIAKAGLTLIFGGGGVGLMGLVSNACMQAGGRVIGIMTEFLSEHEGAQMGITELHIVKTMHERKKKMFDLSDGFLIMPGGFGTLDEAFEILTWRQVGLHDKPIVWLNAYHYWDSLLHHLIPSMVKEGFVKTGDQHLYFEAINVSKVLPFFQSQQLDDKNHVSKWA